jgi:hypothetical protein
MAALQLLVATTLACPLLLLGRYGWQNAAQLVPDHLDAEAAFRKERALKRGAAMCVVMAASLCAAALVTAGMTLVD